MKITRRQALDYRIAAHGLHRDTTTLEDLAVLDLGVQDAGSGSRSSRLALAARLPPGIDTESADLAMVWSFRGAPHLLRRRELATLARELWPSTDADAAARLAGSGTVLKKAGVAGLDAFHAGATAMREVVTTALPRGEISAGVTAALPAAYSYDCATCRSTHVYGSLFQLIGLAAGVELVPDSRPTTLQPLPARHPVPDTASGATRLALAYLRLHGPATPAEFAGYLGTTRTQAAPHWPADLTTIDLDGRAATIPEEQVPALRDAPAMTGARLLPPLDPLLQGRDRELLVPEEVHRKALWKMIGNPGAVLADGEIAGTWRAKLAGRRLTITVDGFTTLPAKIRKAIDSEAQTVAAIRGAGDVTVTHSQG